jgi:site-specific DNA-adenine methylase
MKNHFIISYPGNKRNEVQNVEFIHDIKNLKNIKTICEPFAGTAAFSYYLSTLYPKKFKYILNDIDSNLIELYKTIKNEELIQIINDEMNIKINNFNKYDNDKDRGEYYKTIIKEKTFISWLFLHKIYNIRPGFYPLIVRVKQVKKFDLTEFPIYNFIKNEDVEILNGDGIKLLKDNINNKSFLYFIDPPYLCVANQFYDFYNCNIYEYFNENDIKKFKSKLILILENNWIIKLLFKKYISTGKTYAKTYQKSKNKTEHIIIMN